MARIRGRRKSVGDEQVDDDDVRLRPLPPSSVWWILGGLLVVAAVVTTVLLLAFGDGSESDKVRLEAIRLAGTIVLGTGGAAALFVALRRQRTTELNLIHKQAEAKATQHDAEQRRVTDLYTTAVEQLGHERAAVRLGALYALQRLGQDHPEQRRPIVNVWCAYLRMPFRDPEAKGLTEQERAERRQELEVRLTVQRLLREHVHSGPYQDQPASPWFWGDELDVDLTGATLHNLTLSDRRIHPHTNFNNARFTDGVWFDRARFEGLALFIGARFESDALFGEATFEGDAWFANARFDGRAWFPKAWFGSRAWFFKARLGDASFDKATFDGHTSFDKARFKGKVRFSRAMARHDREHNWPRDWRLVPAEPGDIPEGADPGAPWGHVDTKPVGIRLLQNLFKASYGWLRRRF